MPHLSHAEIRNLLPHRHPMLLVDRVASVEVGQSIVAIKAITGNEACFAHMPDSATLDAFAYPSSLVIESFCQAAGVLCNLSRRASGQHLDGVMLFGSITNYEFEREAFPGDVLEHRVKLDVQLADAAVMSGETWVNGQPLARVERIVVALRPGSALAA
jgi:3-hydroxyacyl-[acyl-carrier-protein] dehydratase